MMNEAYVKGFIEKCAAAGVDPEGLVEKSAILYNEETQAKARKDMLNPDYSKYLLFRKGQPMVLGPGVTYDDWRGAGSPSTFSAFHKGIVDPKKKRFWDSLVKGGPEKFDISKIPGVLSEQPENKLNDFLKTLGKY